MITLVIYRDCLAPYMEQSACLHTYLFCTCPAGFGRQDSVFVDDAIRIWKYYEQWGGSAELNGENIDTVGAISIHVNGNRDGNGQLVENWLDYAVQWCVSSSMAHPAGVPAALSSNSISFRPTFALSSLWSICMTHFIFSDGDL